jgi:predicted GIY-YIG superfamily endonuclease
VYIVRCGDDSLYTGVAKDVAARVAAHNAGRGAAYTRSRLPVSLLWTEKGFTRGGALSREAAVKRLPRPLKQALAKGRPSWGPSRRPPPRSPRSPPTPSSR